MTSQRQRTALDTVNFADIEHRLKNDVYTIWRGTFRQLFDFHGAAGAVLQNVRVDYHEEPQTLQVTAMVSGVERRSAHAVVGRSLCGPGYYGSLGDAAALNAGDVACLKRVLSHVVEGAWRFERQRYDYESEMRSALRARAAAERMGFNDAARQCSDHMDRLEHRWMRTCDEMEQRSHEYRLARAQQQEALTRQMAQQSNDWIERQLLHQMRQFQRQDAVNWYVNQDFADAFGWPYGGDPEADARGIKLLRENLTKAQLAQYDAKKYFDVTGSATGKTYRIKHGRQQNIIEYNDDGKAVALWCFLPTGGLCAGDCMLAQKVALETDEKGALKIANRFHTTAPDDPSLVKPRDKHSKPSSADEVITRKRRDGGWYRRMGNRMGEWW